MVEEHSPSRRAEYWCHGRLDGASRRKAAATVLTAPRKKINQENLTHHCQPVSLAAKLTMLNLFRSLIMMLPSTHPDEGSGCRRCINLRIRAAVSVLRFRFFQSDQDEDRMTTAIFHIVYIHSLVIKCTIHSRVSLSMVLMICDRSSFQRWNSDSVMR